MTGGVTVMAGKKDRPHSAPEKPAKGKDALKSFLESEELSHRLSQIKHKIMVLSGKGGVGKSTVATNMAVALALEGAKVGLLDTDFHGPSVPTLLNLENARPVSDGKSLLPVDFVEGIKVMSIGFLIPNKHDAVIWRGPMKMNVIKQLLTEVDWGKLDYLIVDFPPGTGDEPLTIAQLIPGIDGAVVVTTPQNLSINDVKKCINFCKQVNVPVLGVLENMSGLICPHCNTLINVFKAGGGKLMAEEMGVPFLGSIPIDPAIVEASDDGKPFVYHYNKTESAKAFTAAIKPILEMDATEKKQAVKENTNMKIAIPVTNGMLCQHFGHVESFLLFEVDIENKKIINQESVSAPENHTPGVLPNMLINLGANTVIVSGMGSRAKEILEQNGIQVFTGASVGEPTKLVELFMENKLMFNDNICDH